MEWLKDPRTIIFLIGCTFNGLMFIIIKFNDLKHLERSVNRMATAQEKMVDEQKSQGERIAKIEGRLDAYED